MTVLTNVVLAGLAFVLAVRLGYGAAADGVASGSVLALGFLATALAAMLAATSHGLDPHADADLRTRCWRGALYVSGLVGASCIAAVAFFAARGVTRKAILVFAGFKFLVFVVSLTRRPELRVAAADFGGGLAVLLAAAVYAWVSWGSPASVWIVAGVLVSVVGGVQQARRVGLHRHFNHNDVFHVIQMVALYLVYRGGTLLVDR